MGTRLRQPGKGTSALMEPAAELGGEASTEAGGDMVHDPTQGLFL